MSEPIVFSMTALQHFKRCRKLFELADVRNLVPKRDNEAASNGRKAHEILAAFADNVRAPGTHKEYPYKGDPMYEVVAEYLKRNPFPGNKGDASRVLSVEESFFYEVLPPSGEFGGFYVRCTFDLAYRNPSNPWTTLRDWKTFNKAPSSLDFDMDFQARTYVVTGEQHFKQRCAFEWCYIRQELGRNLKNAKTKTIEWVEWTDDERYLQTPELVLTDVERATTKQELEWLALDILDQLDKQRFYRSDLKGGVFACGSCFHKDLCGSEFSQGELTDDALAELTSPYDPAERVKPQTMLRDPRVRYRFFSGMTVGQAVELYYGRAARVAICFPSCADDIAALVAEKEKLTNGR